MASFTWHYVSKVHPCRVSLHQYFFPFYCQTTFHVMARPCFVCLFIGWWTLQSFPLWSYCKQCCYEHWCTGICVNSRFNLGIYIGVELLGHMMSLCLIFWAAGLCQSGCNVTFLVAMGSHFSISSPTLVITCLFCYIHPNGCEMMLVFILILICTSLGLMILSPFFPWYLWSLSKVHALFYFQKISLYYCFVLLLCFSSLGTLMIHMLALCLLCFSLFLWYFYFLSKSTLGSPV